MLRFLKAVLILSFVALIGSCGSQSKNLVEPEWPYGAKFIYKESAIRLHITADPRLNLYEGEPKTLHLCIYQLRNPNTINQMANNLDGLYQLLDKNCGFSDSSVAGSKALTIYPGEKNTYVLDRAEGAKYVVILAGYFSLEGDRITRLVRVPVIFVKKKTGLFKTVEIAQPDILDIYLTLGPQQIQKMEAK